MAITPGSYNFTGGAFLGGDGSDIKRGDIKKLTFVCPRYNEETGVYEYEPLYEKVIYSKFLVFKDSKNRVVGSYQPLDDSNPLAAEVVIPDCDVYVIRRNNMTAPFTDEEFTTCRDEFLNGQKLVVIQYSGGGLASVIMTGISGGGALLFNRVFGTQIVSYEVYPTPGHAINATYATVVNPNSILQLRVGGVTNTYTPTGTDVFIDVDNTISRLYVPKGSADVATLNGPIIGLEAGWSYVLTDSGTLTSGGISVNVGDNVAWNGSAWFKIGNQATVDALSIISNDEYVYAIVDTNGVVLFSIKADGSVDWPKGIPEHLNAILTELFSRIGAQETLITTKVDKVVGKSLINETFANGVQIVSNSEYVMAIVDSNNVLLFGVKTDGSFDWSKGIPNSIQMELDGIRAILSSKQDAIAGKTLIDNVVSQHSSSSSEVVDWFYCVVDTNKAIIEGILPNGERVFRLPVHFDGGIAWTEQNLSDLTAALKESGFVGGTGDWSDAKSVEIPIPEIAIINFTNIAEMPQTKTTDAHAIMEFWDMNGNYFKKKVIANAQGSSSLAMPKKNIGIDICNDDWVGDDTFKVKFGEWVSQDSFHIKAYYTDFFRCVGLSGYDLVKKMLDTRAPNTTWKKALNYGTDPVGQKSVSPQVDSGALCYPQGFLCKVYLNGVFEGLFCWQLKKHRDNYNLNKKTAENIHLDGMLGGTFFGGTIDWTAFEIRNPKDLITYTGTKYDGDNPTELIDSTSPAYDSSNSKHKLSAKVKQYIINLSQRMAQIGNDPSVFEQYFDVDSCVDYAILSDTIYNYDYVKNIQWTTWDGVKWFINPYDLDCTLGANSAGDGIHYPSTSHITTATGHPLAFVLAHYNTELERRWKDLRDAHIIDAGLISKNLEHYVRLFGKDGYKAEYDKWTNAPCNREPIFDTDNWELERDADGNPVIYTTQYHDWSGAMTYAPGYVVQYNLTGSSIGNFGWWFRFTAKQTNINKPPITQRGFKDNIFRVYNWLNQQISNMDTVYNYT